MREAVLSAPLGGNEEAGREVEVICAVSLFPSALLTFGADSHGSGRLVGAVEEAQQDPCLYPVGASSTSLPIVTTENWGQNQLGTNALSDT